MPLVRMDDASGKTLEYGRDLGEIVCLALTDVLKAAKDDLWPRNIYANKAN